MDPIASRAAYEAEPIDPTAETIINGAPYVAHRVLRADTQLFAEQPHGGLSDEIKRRQIALAVRYVAIARSAMR